MTHSFHIALTGHRPNRLAGYDMSQPYYDRLRTRLAEILADAIVTHDHITAHSGLALGADTMWSRVIMTARQLLPEKVDMTAEVPAMTQSRRWPNPTDRQFWQQQLDAATTVRVYSQICDTAAMRQRNEAMVDAADLLIAVHDGGSRGGTAATVRYARQQGKTILTIHPDELR